MLRELMINLEVSVLAFHSLVDLGQIKNILSCILNHVLSKWSLLPECVIVLHLLSDVLLLCMNDIDILLEKLSQRYVVFIAFLELQF